MNILIRRARHYKGLYSLARFQIDHLYKEVADLKYDLELHKQKRLEAQGMADCMDMVMQELQGAGVIGKDVPPMMLPEAIFSKLAELSKDKK